MKLLSKNDYNKVEELLRAFGLYGTMEEPYEKAMNELISFYKIDDDYYTLLDIFYLHRYEYTNRLPTNATIFDYLSKKLIIPKHTLYLMRKEMVYKAAMIFYKYSLL